MTQTVADFLLTRSRDWDGAFMPVTGMDDGGGHERQ